jgi:hypothetical protein
VPIAPEDYAKTPSHDLLVAASKGHLAVDHRLLHALLDDPARTMPGILQFANEDHHDARVDLAVALMAIFAACPASAAIPFLVSEIRRFPDDIPDQMPEALVRIGPAAIDPILSLDLKTPEIGFLLATIGVADPRIDAYISQIAAQDAEEGKFLRDLYGDYTGPAEEHFDPYNLWDDFDEVRWPDLSQLPAAEIEEFLASPSADLRALGVEAWLNEDLEPEQVARLLDMANKDPDARVRGLAWETLRESSEQDRVLEPMLGRMEQPDVPPVERAGLAIALSYEVERPEVRALIVDLYQDPATRAKALEAMWRSLDLSFEKFIVAHLDDKDADIRREAIAGVGFLRLRNRAERLEALFLDEDFRHDAIYAYALAAPARETKLDLKRLGNRIGELAKGLSDEEAEIVDSAIDMRMRLAGKMSPEPAAEPVIKAKVGRNDPCPCGSGKKYKKCCGKSL